MHAYGHRTKIDDSDLVMTEMQAKDRAYLMLDELMRLYRQITVNVPFDVRVKIFDTAYIADDYREDAPEDLYFLVQGISMSDRSTTYTGIEYGAGVLE